MFQWNINSGNFEKERFDKMLSNFYQKIKKIDKLNEKTKKHSCFFFLLS